MSINSSAARRRCAAIVPDCHAVAYPYQKEGTASQRSIALKSYSHPHVLLATVLLITAIGQRFHFKAVRVVFMILACLLLCMPLLRLLMLPRI